MINKKNEKAKREQNLSLFWVVMGFFFAACFLIVGCTLTGVYYKNFHVYSKLLGAWAGGPGFADYVKNYNANVSSYASDDSSEWVHAGYSLFALGISFILIGGLSAIGLIIFEYWTNPKRKSHEINQHEISYLNEIDENVDENDFAAKKPLIKLKE